MSDEGERALVLFSGGQDSATCLAWALDRFRDVETIAFDYRQRHRVELACAERLRCEIGQVSAAWAARLGDHHVLDLSLLAALSDTALTRERAIAFARSGLPTTFVPGRNLLFLTFAAIVAGRRGQRHLIGGMCETDFSGYPDCRDDTLKAMQVALNLGLDARLVIHTPLMWLDKAATWELAARLGGAALVALIVEHSHTCYLGERGRRHPWGWGCGECPACLLRRDGWRKFSVAAGDAEGRECAG